jgi:hypothetical protein
LHALKHRLTRHNDASRIIDTRRDLGLSHCSPFRRTVGSLHPVKYDVLLAKVAFFYRDFLKIDCAEVMKLLRLY